MGTYQDRRAAKVCVRCGRQTERTLAAELFPEDVLKEILER